MDYFWRVHHSRHGDSASQHVESIGLRVWAFVLSRLRHGLRLVGNRTPAQTRFISETDDLALESPTDMGCQGVRSTVAAWRCRVRIWIRCKDHRAITIAGENRHGTQNPWPRSPCQFSR